MTKQELQERFKAFALRAIRMARAISSTQDGRIIAGQLIRCATSPGANYRAACRARSRADFIAKLAIVEEEIDESAYWLELIIADHMLTEPRVAPLLQEANELTAIITAARKTTGQSRQ